MAVVGALFLKNQETQYKLNVDLRHLRRLANGFYNRNIESLNGNFQSKRVLRELKRRSPAFIYTQLIIYILIQCYEDRSLVDKSLRRT